MKRLAYLLLLASSVSFISCTADDDFSDNGSTSTGNTTNTTSSSSSSSSSSSTSEYVNTDPTTVDFSNDLISNNFTALATTTVTFSSSGAVVENKLDGDTIDVDGNYVIAKLHNEGTILKLTGTSNSGAIYITSDKKFELNLSSLSLTNPNGSVINIQNGHSFVVVDGTNSLSDTSSSEYDDNYSSSAKSVFHSEDKLRFSGSGSLTIKANNSQEKHSLSSDDWIVIDGATVSATSGSNAGQGIKTNDGFYMKSGSVTVSAAGAAKKAINSEGFIYIAGGSLNAEVSGSYAYDNDDCEYKSAVGIKADGYITISGGNVSASSSGAGGKALSTDYIFNMKGGSLSATATGSDTNSSIDKAPKAIKADGNIIIEDGTITASSSNHEGIESKSAIEISGGTIYSKSKDDAINSAGNMTITGGYIFAYATSNDGLDANGNLYIKGGVVFAVTTAGSIENAIDANTEGGYKLYVQGGTLIAYPSIESGSSLSQSCYKASISSTSSWNALYNGSNVAFTFKAPKSGTYIVSTASPSLMTGVTVKDGTSIFEGYGNIEGIVSGGSSVSLSTYTSSSNMGFR